MKELVFCNGARGISRDRFSGCPAGLPVFLQPFWVRLRGPFILEGRVTVAAYRRPAISKGLNGSRVVLGNLRL